MEKKRIPFVNSKYKADNLHHYLYIRTTYILRYNNAVLKFKDCNMSDKVIYEGFEDNKLVFTRVTEDEDFMGGIEASIVYKIPLQNIHNFTLSLNAGEPYDELFKVQNIFSKIKYSTICQINPAVKYNHYYKIYGSIEELVKVEIEEDDYTTTFNGEICTIVKNGSGTDIHFFKTNGECEILSCGYVEPYFTNIELEEI